MAELPERERERVLAVVRRVPELAGDGHRMSLLSGGITNRNIRVDAADGSGSFVVRLAGEGTEALGIDRAREHACSRAAEAAGIGAEVVAFLPDLGALVTRFVDGDVLTADAMKRPDVMSRAADALRRFHDGPPVPGSFSPFEVVRAYHALARARAVPFPALMDGALARLDQVEQALGEPGPARPCHNDLLPGNFIDDGARVRIIDWEYAGMGDRFFDLGNLAVNHGLTDEEERALLALYFGEARGSDLRRLRLMRLASDMREALWGFVQAGISSLDVDFIEYGRAHLDRFEAAFDASALGLLEPGIEGSSRE